MGKNQYTELDKLFQSKLKEGKVESGIWNDPTDDIFLAAMDSVNTPETKKKKRVFWPFYLFAFLGLLSLGVWNTKKVGELSTTISEIQLQGNQNPALSVKDGNQVEIAPHLVVDKNVEKSEDPKKVQTINKLVQNKKSKSTSSSNNNDEKLRNNPVANTNNQIIPPTYTNNSSNQSKANSPLRNSFTLINTDSNEKSNDLLTTSGKESITMVDHLELTPSVLSLLNIANRDNFILPITAAETQKTETRNPLAIYAFLDLNLNSMRMSGLEGNDFILRNYDQSYLGYNVGLGALKEINDRYGIAFNLAYRRVKNHSIFENDMLFDHSHMMSGVNGEMMYQLNADVHTPTGTYQFREEISMEDGGSIEDQEMMFQSTDIHQYFNFISLGVQPRINLWSQNNLNLFAEAGLNLNYLMSFCQEIEMKMYHDNHMMMKKDMEDHSMSTINRLSLAGSLGLGLEYQIGDHIFSSFRFGSSRSLNSIRQENNADNVRTFIDNLGVSLTAGYKF